MVNTLGLSVKPYHECDKVLKLVQSASYGWVEKDEQDATICVFEHLAADGRANAIRTFCAWTKRPLNVLPRLHERQWTKDVMAT